MQIRLDSLPWMRSSRWNIAIADVGQPFAHPALSNFVPILPRFLRPGGLKRRDERLHPTAYLDSLRGWAACIVFAYDVLGSPKALDYPFIRILTHGGAPVTILFVTSGYVLSFRMLKLMRNQESVQLLHSLASSTFRRYLRLYIPTALASFVAMLCVWRGWMSPVSNQGSFPAQFWDWLIDTFQASDPFHDVVGRFSNSHTFGTKYLPQMWTIPVEFRGSMVLFAVCTAASQMSTAGRMVFTWIAIFLCLAWQSIYGALFLMGMFIADLSMSCKTPAEIQLPTNSKGEEPTRPPRLLRCGAANLAFIFTLVVSLFLLSQPAHLKRDEGSFPWPFLYSLIPSWYSGPGDPLEHFWLGIGAFLLVLTLEFSPTFQLPLRWPFSLYLGEISFGIYVMHNTVNFSLYQKILEPFREKHLANSPSAYVGGLAILTFVVLWTADYFARVDKKVTALLRGLESMVFVGGGGGGGSEKRAQI